MERNKMISCFKRWHWITRWATCSGIILLIYFYLFDDSYSLNNLQSGSSGTNLLSDEQERLRPNPSIQELTERKLPPLERFTAMVERPLFSPARRSVKVDVGMEEVDRLEPPAFPLFGFVGTIDQGGRIRALTDGPWGHRIISAGEEVNGWQVVLVERRRLGLERDNEQLELHIGHVR
jgi:hypothetical protein